MPPADPTGPPSSGPLSQDISEHTAPPEIRYDLAGNPLPPVGSGQPAPDAQKPGQPAPKQPYPEPRQVYSAPHAPPSGSAPAAVEAGTSEALPPRRLNWGILLGVCALIGVILLLVALKLVHHH